MIHTNVHVGGPVLEPAQPVGLDEQGSAASFTQNPDGRVETFEMAGLEDRPAICGDGDQFVVCCPARAQGVIEFQHLYVRDAGQLGGAPQVAGKGTIAGCLGCIGLAAQRLAADPKVLRAQLAGQ